MLLAIDGGNTNIVFGLRKTEDDYLTWRMATASATTADDYAAWLSFHLANHGFALSDISGVIISTVVPDTLSALKRFAELYLPEPRYVLMGDDLSHGVVIAIDKPEQAGADRIANTAAASHYYPRPAIVIDFGTATTFDYVSKEGAYCGGVISPGVNLSVGALYQAAARLPLIDPKHWHTDMPVIGKSTIEAMNSGLFFGYASLVEGIIARMKADIASDQVTVLATGGLGQLFADAISIIDHYDANLTLKGLAIIFKRQQDHL
ncbi:MAG: type III pantothenate kinase [Proteobacteria bacterium]|nr:type III pantothenate kinase [Pseudomonadota bacterium]